MAPLHGEYFNYHCIGGYRLSPRAVEIVLSQYLVGKKCLANISGNWCCDASAHCNEIIINFFFEELLFNINHYYVIHYLMHYSQLRMV